MKKIFLSLVALFLFTAVHAQLNMTLRSNFEFQQGNLNDIWGWHHEETGKEYAIVGRTIGTSVIDVTDPDNPVDVGFFPGANTTWRDIKTWGDYAYVTNEQADGVAVLYLGDLPSGGELTGFNWTPNIPGLGTLNTCHNIYIDEFGYAYLAGCDLNSGGMLIVDVFTTPGDPQFVAAAPPVYSHDVFVRDNRMYSSEIYDGEFTIYDVTDKENITELGAQTTDFEFTHNTWLSDDSNTIFTTDELANAPVGAYDISDPTDIVELDQFVPLETLGEGVIPHNVHVWQDWLIISYYTDGGIVVDASVPDNLIEVGNFDTFFTGSGGFSGAWGAYPFLPSETVLLTDITNGLYVVTPTYVRACRVEGLITNADTGNPIAGANVDIDADQINGAQSDFTGEYKTGIATAGTYSVTYSAQGYLPQTLELTLENGVIVEQDVQLEPLPNFSLSGNTVEAEGGASVADAQVVIFNEDFLFESESDASGNFSLSGVTEGSYTVVAGKWGYNYGTAEITLSADSDVVIELDRGYQDDFVFDFGWDENGNSSTGIWERGVPIGTQYQGGLSNPGADVNNDIGNTAYVTGNGGGNAGNDDVDDGETILISPIMDLTFMDSPVINYRTWFFNDGGQGTPPNDDLIIKISNGTDEVTLETIDNSNDAWRPTSSFPLLGLLDITENMQLTVTATDYDQGHLVEGGFDKFLVTDDGPSSVYQPVDFAVSVVTSPNPFQAAALLTYVLDTDFERATLTVHNQLGQQVEVFDINDRTGSVTIGEQLATGVYFVRLEADGMLSATEKIVKTK